MNSALPNTLTAAKKLQAAGVVQAQAESMADTFALREHVATQDDLKMHRLEATSAIDLFRAEFHAFVEKWEDGMAKQNALIESNKLYLEQKIEGTKLYLEQKIDNQEQKIDAQGVSFDQKMEVRMERQKNQLMVWTTAMVGLGVAILTAVITLVLPHLLKS